MKAIVRSFIASKRVSLIAWCVAPSAYMLLVTSVYHSFLTPNSAQIDRVFAGLPAGIRSFMQIQGDFLSPVGFLSSEPYYVILPLVMIALGIALGASLIRSEEKAHTLELLLSRPISRGKLLLSKIVAGLLILALVNMVVGIVICVSTRIFGLDVAISHIWLTQLSLFLLSMIFSAFSFMISAFGHKVAGGAVGASTLVAIAGYIFTSLASNVHWLEWPAKLLPYHYYDPRALLSGNISWRAMLSFVCVALILYFLAWLAFRQRDIE